MGTSGSQKFWTVITHIAHSEASYNPACHHGPCFRKSQVLSFRCPWWQWIVTVYRIHCMGGASVFTMFCTWLGSLPLSEVWGLTTFKSSKVMCSTLYDDSLPHSKTGIKASRQLSCLSVYHCDAEKVECLIAFSFGMYKPRYWIFKNLSFSCSIYAFYWKIKLKFNLYKNSRLHSWNRCLMIYCHNANLHPKVPSKMVHETRKISSGGRCRQWTRRILISDSYMYYVWNETRR